MQALQAKEKQARKLIKFAAKIGAKIRNFTTYLQKYLEKRKRKKILNYYMNFEKEVILVTNMRAKAGDSKAYKHCITLQSET